MAATADSKKDDDKESTAEVDPRFPLVNSQHIIRGVRLLGVCTREHFSSIENMAVVPRDWFVITYPKAGTTWMQEIMYLLKTDGNTTKADSLPVYVRIPMIDMPTPQYGLEEGDAQHLYKSHLPVQFCPRQLWQSKPKTVVVHRNPKDIAVSFYYMYQSCWFQGNWTRGWDEFLEMFISGNTTYGDWFKWTRDWWRARDDSHQLHVTYEWMKRHPREAIIKVARFLEKEPDEELVDRILKRTSFQFMRDHPMSNYSTMTEIDTERIPFMRKGTVGDWKNHFTVAQSERYDALYNKELSGYDDLIEFLNTTD